MTIIGKIRNRIGLIFGSILVAIVAFLLMDVFSGNSPFSSQNRQNNNVGTIDDESVSNQFFAAKVDEQVENYKANAQTSKVDENTLDMLRDQVWNDLVNSKILAEQYDRLGIMVSESELLDMIQGRNIHPSVKQAFTNQATGQFDKNQAIQFLKNLDKQQPDIQKRWIQFEEYILKERLQQKYNTLVGKGIYTPSVLVAQNYKDQNIKASGQMIMVDYNTINDTLVKPTDDELKAYFSENKDQFKQKKFRKLEYVFFDLLPSKEDTANIYKTIEEKKIAFQSAPSDTDFVNQNSDMPFENNWLSKKTMATTMSDALFNAASGVVVGPYQENGYVKISKVIGRTSRPDSVNARHILFKAENGVTLEQAKNQADSVKKLVQAGADFAPLAMTLSKDPGSAAKGGDLGTFGEGAMVKPFNDACFDGKTGDITVVTSDFGVHLIQIRKQIGSNPAIKLATVALKLDPSDETSGEAYKKASIFAGDNRDIESFNAAVKEQGLNKRIADRITPSDKSVMNMPGTREIVRWAFQDKTKIGDVSEVFSNEKGYVVACITSGAEDGIPALDVVKEEVARAVVKEKKAAKIGEEFKSQMAKAKGNIQKLGELTKHAAMPFADAQFSAGFIPAVGREPSLVGAIFGAKLKALQGPIKGDLGVFMFVTESVTDPGKVPDVKAAREQQDGMLRSRVATDVISALKENAKIEDNRYLFY